MSISWYFECERWYEEYRAFLERLGLRFAEQYYDETDTESETSDDEDYIPDGMLIATPEGSDWGDDLNELPSLDDL